MRAGTWILTVVLAAPACHGPLLSARIAPRPPPARRAVPLPAALRWRDGEGTAGGGPAPLVDDERLARISADLRLRRGAYRCPPPPTLMERAEEILRNPELVDDRTRPIQIDVRRLLELLGRR